MAISFTGQPSVQSKRFGSVPFAQATKFAPLLAAEQQYDENLKAGQATSQLSNPNITTPYGSRRITYNPDGSVNLDQSMSPGEQSLYDTNTRLRQGIANQGENLLGQFSYDRPINTANLPGRVSNVDLGNMLGQLDTSGIPKIPGQDDLAAFRQQAQDAAYKRNTEYLDPQFAQGESDTRTRLANQGITEGSEAWNRDWRNFGDTKQRAYDSARTGAIGEGRAEAESLYGMGAGTNAQLFGQLLQGGEFANQAQGQRAGQQFAQAGLTNEQRQAQLQEDLQLRDLPLQELLALQGGSQYNLPEFQNYQGTTIDPMDYEGAVGNIIGLQNQKDAAKKTNQGQILGSLLGLGGKLGGAYLGRP